MKLGAFSLSLTVKDIAVSRAFYEKLGFEKFHGDTGQGWLIMKSPSCVIGLFQGMFDKNMLTFNPGWTNEAETVEGAIDIREIQKKLKADGVVIINEVDEASSGPGSFMINDPDGNSILIDQHV